MRIANVISSTRLERIQSEPQRRTDLPPGEEAHDELRAGRGILLAVGLGIALWAVIILGIKLLLH